jgi:hypothetical protein
MASQDENYRSDFPFPVALGVVAFLAIVATVTCLIIVILAGAGMPGWPREASQPLAEAAAALVSSVARGLPGVV